MTTTTQSEAQLNLFSTTAIDMTPAPFCTEDPFYAVTKGRIATTDELLSDATYGKLTNPNYPNLTAEALLTVKADDGRTPLHVRCYLHQIPGATAEFLSTIKNHEGRTPLHGASELYRIDGATAEFLATVQDNFGFTPLHGAAKLHRIGGATAEFLATVKSHDGETPLHEVVRDNQVTLIPGITVELLEMLGLLEDALRPENFICLTDDFRANGCSYTATSYVGQGLLEAASQLPHPDDTLDAGIRRLLTAAIEGGFQLPPEALAKLM